MSNDNKNKYFVNLSNSIETKNLKVGVIGLGYVGLPLALSFCRKGIEVIGFEINKSIVNLIRNGKSHIKHINSLDIEKYNNSKKLVVNNTFEDIRKVDAILVCVPTPLTTKREPDLSYIINTINEIGKFLKEGQILSLESTTYPGTTDEVIKPLIESYGFKIGKNFFLNYSPEREDPGNKLFKSYEIPKVIGGDSKYCSLIGRKLYEIVNKEVVIVSSTKAAEMTKLLENVYRAVNIALVNEIKMFTDKIDIDIHEIINAASTKPFGFKPFYPGPGVGGHCIPIDPIYLSWKSNKDFGLPIKFVALAEEINSRMPNYVLKKTKEALQKKSLLIENCKILILGISYKKNIDDFRESPSIEIINNLLNIGASVSYSDPYIPEFTKLNKNNFNQKSLNINIENLKKQDCIILLTDHDSYDYTMLQKYCKLIIDTKGKFKISKNIVKA